MAKIKSKKKKRDKYRKEKKYRSGIYIKERNENWGRLSEEQKLALMTQTCHDLIE